MTGWTGYVEPLNLSKSSKTGSNNTGTGRDSLFRLNFNTEAKSHPKNAGDYFEKCNGAKAKILNA